MMHCPLSEESLTGICKEKRFTGMPHSHSLAFPQSVHLIFYYLRKAFSSRVLALQMFLLPAALDILSVAE